VANGMESEPASRKDQALLARAPHLVLDGAVLAAGAVGADTVHVCLDRSRAGQAAAIRAAVEERQRAARPDPVRILVHELPRGYVSSEETALVSWLNGGEARPRATPPRPFERGVGRRPTLVDNVETLAHLALIGRYGPDWFREAGDADAPGTRLVTVAGAAARPGVYEIEGSTLVGDVLAMSGAAGRAVLIGGYFGTWHGVSDIAGRPLTAGGLRPAGGSPGAGLVYVLPDGCCGLAAAARILRYLAQQGAQQCGPCMFGLPAIAADLEQLAAARPEAGLLGRLDRRLGVIPGRGACRHPDGAVRMAASALAAFAEDARSHAAGHACPAAARRGPQPDGLPVPRAGPDGGWR
jgi:NADH:ubiquinone oxidoreductase subunit F (NADH-binding)